MYGLKRRFIFLVVIVGEVPGMTTANEKSKEEKTDDISDTIYQFSFIE